MVDLAGGGDLLQRLLPKTHAWARLEAAREAARRADEAARRAAHASSDELRTIFFLGFDLDEQVAERLSGWKRSGRVPAEALPLTVDLQAPFEPGNLSHALTIPGEKPRFEVVPGGRRMEGTAPKAPEILVRRLAAALVPLGERYSMPFFLRRAT